MSRRAATLLVATVVVLDQLTKYIASVSIERGQAVDLLPGIELVNVRNEGVAFGLFAGKGILLSIFATAAVLALLFIAAKASHSSWVWVPAGLLFGGAAGNLIDRVRIGAVIDFIDLPFWPPFNVADIAVTVGAFSLAAAIYRGTAPSDRSATPSDVK